MTERPGQTKGQQGSSALRRLGRYGPLLLWVGFIWFASTGEFSSDNSSRFVRPLLLWLFPGISEGQLAGVHFLTRKASHLAEYAVLAFLAVRAFASSSQAVIQRRWFQLALSLVVISSLLDEFHQSFTPARSGSLLDSVIDVVGGMIVLLICRAYYRRSESAGGQRAWRVS